MDAELVLQVMERESELLKSIGYSILSNITDAEDAIQETKIKVLKSAPRTEIRDVRAWVCKVLINECYQIGRKKSRLFIVDDIFEVVEASEHLVVEQIQFDDDGLSDLVNSLPEIYRQVVIYRFWSDMKVDQIAQVIGIPSGTVKSRLNFALKILKFRYMHADWQELEAQQAEEVKQRRVASYLRSHGKAAV